MAASCVLALLCASEAAAQNQAEDARLAHGYETRALQVSAGHSWRFGWNDASLSTSDVTFVGFHPQLGWFQTSRFELFGEGTLQVYVRPRAVFAGLMGIGGRWHFHDNRAWTPYVTGSAGLGWTSLDIVEIDRVFNFQVVWGFGLRQVTRQGPGWMIEFRNHHISNAGTRGENIGINSATIVVGGQWIIR